MPKNRTFRETDIQGVVTIIRNWPKEKISWTDLCQQSEPLLGFLPTRQGLYQRAEIRDAFQAKQKGLRLSPQDAMPVPSSLAVAANTIKNLKNEVAELKLVNSRLRDKFITWQYNAYTRGLTEADLNKPLPETDREVSVVSVKKKLR